MRNMVRRSVLLSLGCATLSASAFASSGITFTSVTHNFGTVPVGYSDAYGVKVTNSSSSSFAFSLTLSGSSQFAETNSCGASLAAGSSCDIQFTFTPTSSASATATWTLAANGETFSPSDGGTLNGTGTSAANLSLSLDNHDFSTQLVGTTSASFGTILTNATGDPMALTFTSPAQAADFPVVLNNCPATLPAYASCNLQYAFDPASAQTNYKGTYKITAVDSTTGAAAYIFSSGSPTSGVTLSGSGIAANGLRVSTGGHNFGEVDTGVTSVRYGFQLQNGTTNTVDLTYGATPAGFEVYSTTCGATLASGASCDAEFVFAPASAIDYNAVFPVSATSSGSAVSLYQVGGSTPLSGVTLVGFGVTDNPTVATGSFTFGTYADGETSATVTDVIHNPATHAITLSYGFDGADPSDYTVDNPCGTTLAANTSCTVSFSFAPVGTGSLQEVFALAASDPTNGQAVSTVNAGKTAVVTGVVLSGRAVATASVSLSSAGEAFSQVGVGTTSGRYTTLVSNSTSSAVTLAGSWSSSTEAANFNVTSDGCEGTLAANSTCSVVFDFAPTAAGTFSDDWDIAVTGGTTETLTVALSGTGVD